MGNMRFAQGRLDEALKLVDQSLDIQVLENDAHSLVAASRMKRARILLDTNKADEAMSVTPFPHPRSPLI
jgi:uncharacterized membrane-anchored protein